jgi:hypothetical protein
MTSVALECPGPQDRAILTVLAIGLGVAIVNGAYVLTDSVDGAFRNVFSSALENTSVIIFVSGEEIGRRSRLDESPFTHDRDAPYEAPGKRRGVLSTAAVAPSGLGRSPRRMPRASTGIR